MICESPQCKNKAKEMNDKKNMFLCTKHYNSWYEAKFGKVKRLSGRVRFKLKTKIYHPQYFKEMCKKKLQESRDKLIKAGYL